MLPDLLLDEHVGYRFDEIVYGVDARMDALEALDLLADGERVAQVRMTARVHRVGKYDRAPERRRGLRDDSSGGGNLERSSSSDLEEPRRHLRKAYRHII